MKKNIIIIIASIFILSSRLFATNDLSIKDNGSNGSKPGYIEKATLVIEPFGGYVVQSLYLEYSDRNQFSSNQLEIVHRFELPKDAVVNDMWLWIGDSVMQAKMFDTWSARHTYDSIVGAKYDPAFLAKNGTQYELKIYPLQTGKYRRVKITFISPTMWFGNQATAELPIKLLLSNHSLKKPLEVLFRTQKEIWGIPSISESPQSKFVNLVDTLGYKYKCLEMNDISGYSSLTLKFDTEFTDGYYINGFQDKSDSTYFQLGIEPENFFKVKIDSSSRNVLVALDLSGSYRKDLAAKLPDYRSLIQSSLKPNDNFKFIVSGNNQIIPFTNSFLPASSLNINNAVNNFQNSDLAKGIDLYYSKNILFCDGQASTNWNFPALPGMAHVTVMSDMKTAMNSISKSDVVAGYNHGFENPLDDAAANNVILRLDTLFTNGGRFLTYYDYNRTSREKLAVHYIEGLKVKTVIHDALTLYRNPDGNIGKDFPESFTRNASYFFEFTDPDVKVELRDQAGNASVISKKIRNGLIVVTGIWSLNDDNAMKALLGAPLLGINSNSKPYTLDDLLARIKQEYNSTNFKRAVILSDSDSLISKVDAVNSARDYINGYGISHPQFYTLNLLENDLFTPPYLVDGQTEYYGSGYFLNQLASESKGVHMEKHLYDWPYISSVFSPYALPSLTNLTINTNIDGGTGKVLELREVNIIADPNKPKFYLGVSNALQKIDFDISGRFEGALSDSTKKFTYLVQHDTTSYNFVVRSMLGNENINDLFRAIPIDTAKIISKSIYFSVLTDYTSLLALEPNEKYHFMKNPLDEGGLTVVKDEKENSDSTFVSVYPNPFNSMTTIKLHLKSSSDLSASIYNILGQKVIDIVKEQNVSGNRVYTWNGRNNYGSTVGSGFYILRVVLTDNLTKKGSVLTRKLVYLK